MKENRLVVTEERVFVSGDESKLKEQIEIFGFSDYQNSNFTIQGTQKNSESNPQPKVLFVPLRT